MLHEVQDAGVLEILGRGKGCEIFAGAKIVASRWKNCYMPEYSTNK
jgi:hypothetical protein